MILGKIGIQTFQTVPNIGQGHLLWRVREVRYLGEAAKRDQANDRTNKPPVGLGSWLQERARMTIKLIYECVQLKKSKGFWKGYQCSRVLLSPEPSLFSLKPHDDLAARFIAKNLGRDARIYR